MSLSKPELIVARLGGSLHRAAQLYGQNSASFSIMAKKAKSSGKKVNGYTAQQLVAFAADSALRAEWTEMLADNDSLRASRSDRDETSTAWLDRISENCRTLLAALDTPKAQGPLFSMKLASVGNPDMRQYHGEGEGSPTFTVEAESFVTLIKIYSAYTPLYDLGGGNVARDCGDIYREGALVARISYNGRLWTPEKFPDCRELDPVTGNVKKVA